MSEDYVLGQFAWKASNELRLERDLNTNFFLRRKKKTQITTSLYFETDKF